MANREAPPSTADRISALPDGVREHVLSFLPAHEAVRTTVLAHSWRDLWMRSPALHITRWGTVDRFIKFVRRLLRLRCLGTPASWRHPTGNPGAAWAPLDSCHFDLSSWRQTDEEDFDEARADGWIKWTLRCEVRELRFHYGDIDGVQQRLELSPRHWPLASEHLTKLELYDVAIADCLDFSSCPSLLNLKIYNSSLDPEEIWSPSLQHLSITLCDFCQMDRTRIRTPSLVLLQLDCLGRTPLLETMPSLEYAYVEFYHSETFDKCSIGSIHGCGRDICVACQDYYGPHNDHTSCVLLNGLSQATDLVLSAHPDVFVFSRDIKCCPTFRNLKTLELADWFVADDFSGLIWFLHHSPILEELTLRLTAVENKSVGKKERCEPLEQSAVSDHLETIEIKCHEVDAMVVKILKILAASGIPLERINIKSSMGPDYVNFKCIGLSSK